MSNKTKIQYADSTLNLQMGCQGCELWLPAQGVKRCYAGTLTQQYAGRKGWPERFEKATIFPERMKTLAGWKDMTGDERPDKPWLNGYPRVVFLNDMGDTFSEDLDGYWMLPYLPILQAMPHVFILLTKRPKRMVNLFRAYGSVPANFWLLASITSGRNEGRAWDLLDMRNHFPDAVLGVSMAPLWDKVVLPWEDLNWAITEGESGDINAIPTHPDWFRSVRDGCAQAGTPYFHKQNGAWAHESQVTEDIRTLINAGAEMGIRRRHVWADGTASYYTGRNGAGRLLDGIQHNGMPTLRQPCAKDLFSLP